MQDRLLASVQKIFFRLGQLGITGNRVVPELEEPLEKVVVALYFTMQFC